MTIHDDIEMLKSELRRLSNLDIDTFTDTTFGICLHHIALDILQEADELLICFHKHKEVSLTRLKSILDEITFYR